MKFSAWQSVAATMLAVSAVAASAQATQPSAQSATTTPGASAANRQRVARLDQYKTPTKADLLIGQYGPYRANNDLLSYALKIRVDPEAKTIKGENRIRFRMLADGKKIQLELTPALTIDGITLNGKALQYTREERSVFVDFADTLHKGQVYEIAFAYSGQPVTQGRFGCFSFDKDKEGKPWITTACESEGASIWWPNKDQWRDEPQEGMTIQAQVPNGLVDVSNGRLEGSKDLGDGYTEWDWRVHYPINNYDVSLNIGQYQHFTLPNVGATTLDFYALPENLEKAKVTFQQAPEMIRAFEHYLGEYPWVKDGYKLVDVPYTGMEHQSAVTYGNRYENGYYGRDWTGVGISPRFDFIIIHESGHEWFGNSVSAADKSDMWVHEGWDTYLEGLYVEYRWGKADALRYVNGYKAKVHNQIAIVAPRDTNTEPPQDQYFKSALMINTLRSVIGDDTKWFADLHDFYQRFKYQNIMTEDVETWWSQRTGMNLKPFFEEYLRHAKIPTLELMFDPSQKTVQYRWDADEAAFAMPVMAGEKESLQPITPSSTDWKTMPWAGKPDDFTVPDDLYYINVKRETAPKPAA